MRRATLLAAMLAAVPAAAAPQPQDDAVAPETELTFPGTVTVQTTSGPRVRLEQDTTLGRPPYVWDFGGNDREFFVVDLTGFRLPVRIATGIPSAKGPLTLEGTTGDLAVGGDFPPLCPLHLWNPAGGDSRLLIEEASSTVAARNLVRFRNNGPLNVAFSSSFSPVWAAGSGKTGSFFIRTSATPALELSPAGNLTIAGTLLQVSDRGAKEHIEPLDAPTVLARVAALPLATWSYKGDSAKHVGPMAQDFAVAFGLGTDDTHVAPSDVAGVGLAAVQALHARLGALRQRMAALEERTASAVAIEGGTR